MSQQKLSRVIGTAVLIIFHRTLTYRSYFTKVWLTSLLKLCTMCLIKCETWKTALMKMLLTCCLQSCHGQQMGGKVRNHKHETQRRASKLHKRCAVKSTLHKTLWFPGAGTAIVLLYSKDILAHSDRFWSGLDPPPPSPHMIPMGITGYC